jgi:translocation and assembly module TamA
LSAERVARRIRRTAGRPRLPIRPRARRDPRAAAALAFAGLLLALAAFRPRPARAADPQPYDIHWVSSGNSAVDSQLKLSSELEALRKSAPVGPYGLIARARADVPRLATVLQSFGYYLGAITVSINGRGLETAALGPAIAALPKGTAAQVTIRPTLGPLFHLGRIEVIGALPPGMRRELRLAPGAPAVAATVLDGTARLQTALQNAGYPFARVAKPIAYEVPARHLLNLTLHVSTGTRRRIGRITIAGLAHVHRSLVMRRLEVHTGERYDAATVEKARQDLLALGVFSSVSVRLGKPERPGRVPLVFTVREAKRYVVGFSAAYSSDLGASGGVNWGDRNVFGNGEKLNLSATAINLGGSATTGLGYDSEAAFTIPDFRRDDQTLEFTAIALRQALEAYTQTGEMAGATLTRRLSSLWTATAGVAYEHEIVSQENAQYRYDLLSVPVTAHFDSTDLSSPLLDPTHGLRISASVSPTFSYGVRGKTYIVLQGSIASYFDVHRLVPADPAGRTVLAARAMGGVALGATQFSLPPDQRFYAGGSGTVRGYRYQAVGPQFPDGNPIGGTNMQALNLELRQRVGTSFGVVGFVDSGGVSSPSGSVYRVGVGAGVLYYTSIGPIRFDVGFPTTHLRHSDSFEIYIGLGQSF